MRKDSRHAELEGFDGRGEKITHDEAIKTIREALEYYMEIEVDSPGKEALAALSALSDLAALSAIDPDALTIESVNAGIDVGLNGEQASADARYAYRSNPFAHRIADTIRYSAHDDAIRRECADKAVEWFNEPDLEYWNNQLRYAITGKEPTK